MSRTLELRSTGWLNVAKSASCAEVAKLVENSADFCSPNSLADGSFREATGCLSPINSYSARRSYRSIAYKTWAISTERQLNASQTDFGAILSSGNDSGASLDHSKAISPVYNADLKRFNTNRARSEVPSSHYSEETNRGTDLSSKTDKICPMELNSSMTKSWPKGNASKPPMPPGRNGLRNGLKLTKSPVKAGAKQTNGLVPSPKSTTNGYHKTVVEPIPLPKHSELKSNGSLNLEHKNNTFGFSDWNLNKMMNIFNEIQNTVKLETQTVKNGFYALRKSLSRELIKTAEIPTSPIPSVPQPLQQQQQQQQQQQPQSQQVKPIVQEKLSMNPGIPGMKFSSCNEAIEHLKQELLSIRDHDMKMINQLLKLHEEISEIKENDIWIDDLDDSDVINLPKVPKFLTPQPLRAM